MSNPEPPGRPSRDQATRALHTTALVAVIACPLLALLPPRKLDVYTVGLVGATGYSANHLIRESSGRSIWQHVNRLDTEQHRADVTRTPPETHESWKTRREKEIRDDVDQGKGFGDMIYDQIWEVWNWGKPKDP